MGWTDVVTALAVSVIALLFMALSVGWLFFMREARGVLMAVERVTRMLEEEARPTIDSARGLVTDTSAIVHSVRGEIEAITATSQDIRERVGDLTESVEDRLGDLEALVDVVYDEVEETALDVAAALRTTRRSLLIGRAMKRAFFGRKR
jgi:uncharacterized protein YoxC